MSNTSSVMQKVAEHVPTAYLLGWATGAIPWDQVAGFMACLWTAGLMWNSWLWKPWLKPKWDRRKAHRKAHGNP